MDADTVIITGPSIGNCPLVLRPPVIPNIPLIDTVHFASISQGSSSRSFEPELVPPFNIASTAEVWSGPRFKLRGPSPTPWSDQPVLLHKFCSLPLRHPQPFVLFGRIKVQSVTAQQHKSLYSPLSEASHCELARKSNPDGARTAIGIIPVYPACSIHTPLCKYRGTLVLAEFIQPRRTQRQSPCYRSDSYNRWGSRSNLRTIDNNPSHTTRRSHMFNCTTATLPA